MIKSTSYIWKKEHGIPNECKPSLGVPMQQLDHV